MTVLLSNVYWPNGIAWRNGSLYVSGFYNQSGVLSGFIARYDNIDQYAMKNQVGCCTWPATHACSC